MIYIIICHTHPNTISLAHFHHQIRIVIDRNVEARRHECRGERKFDDGRTSHPRARAEERIVVDLGFDELSLRTGEKDFSFTLPRRRGLSLRLSVFFEPRFRDSADGIDSDLADLDPRFGVTGADPVKLLIFFLEGAVHFGDPFGVETVPAHRHFNSSGLTAITHRKETAEFHLTGLESFSGHCGFHLGLDGTELMFTVRHVCGVHVLAENYAVA